MTWNGVYVYYPDLITLYWSFGAAGIVFCFVGGRHSHWLRPCGVCCVALWVKWGKLSGISGVAGSRQTGELEDTAFGGRRRSRRKPLWKHGYQRPVRDRPVCSCLARVVSVVKPEQRSAWLEAALGQPRGLSAACFSRARPPVCLPYTKRDNGSSRPAGTMELRRNNAAPDRQTAGKSSGNIKTRRAGSHVEAAHPQPIHSHPPLLPRHSLNPPPNHARKET